MDNARRAQHLVTRWRHGGVEWAGRLADIEMALDAAEARGAEHERRRLEDAGAIVPAWDRCGSEEG